MLHALLQHHCEYRRHSILLFVYLLVLLYYCVNTSGILFLVTLRNKSMRLIYIENCIFFCCFFSLTYKQQNESHMELDSQESWRTYPLI